jgi:hypothetical protein
MKNMKDGSLHGLHVLHGLTIKRAHTYPWAMRNISYTNPNKLLLKSPQPNLLPLEKGWHVNLLGLVLLKFSAKAVKKIWYAA